MFNQNMLNLEGYGSPSYLILGCPSKTTNAILWETISQL